jgi:hypothetical protein
MDIGARLPADLDRFPNRVRIGSIHRPRVRCVDPAERCGFLDKRRQLVGGHVDIGHIAHAARYPDRPFQHGLAHQSPHLIEFLGRRRAIHISHDVRPNGAGANVGREVGGRAPRFQEVQAAAERPASAASFRRNLFVLDESALHLAAERTR